MLQGLPRALCALALCVLASNVEAQPRSDYPKRPVRFIVAQTPGGNADFVGRIKDLIALARAKPGELNYGVSSIAGATQLAAELFNLMANVKITQIPYKGAPAMLVDLMGARIDLSFATMPSSMAHVRSGKLRGIAVTSSKRSALVPELPTIAENGLPGYEMVAWQGLLAPRATPAALIQFIHRETVAVINQPEARKQLAAEGGEVVGNPPEEFARWLKAEIAKWTEVVKDANIRVE